VGASVTGVDSVVNPADWTVGREGLALGADQRGLYGAILLDCRRFALPYQYAAVHQRLSHAATHVAPGRTGLPGRAGSAKAECQRLDASVLALHKTQNQQAEETHAITMARIAKRRQAELERADRDYPQRLTDLSAWRDRTLQENDQRYPLRLREIKEQYRSESERLRARHDAAIEESRQQFERQWAEMAERWRSGIAQFQASLDGLDALCRNTFPDWHTADWNRFALARAIPPVIRFGRTEIDLARSKGACPRTSGFGRRGLISRCRCCCPILGDRC